LYNLAAAQNSGIGWLSASSETVALDRYLNRTNVEFLEEEVEGVIDSGARILILDCSSLCFLTASGLRIFLSIARKMYNAGGSVFIKGMKGQPRHMFFLCSMDSVVPMVKSETRVGVR